MKEKVTIQALSPDILQQGKSKRLAAIREKVSQQSRANELVTPKKKPPSDLEKARRLIDLAVNQWLMRYPPAKKQRFFTIRFGMTLEQFKQRPIEEIYRRLQITEQAPEKIAKLDYNGRPVP